MWAFLKLSSQEEEESLELNAIPVPETSALLEIQADPRPCFQGSAVVRAVPTANRLSSSQAPVPASSFYALSWAFFLPLFDLVPEKS